MQDPRSDDGRGATGPNDARPAGSEPGPWKPPPRRHATQRQAVRDDVLRLGRDAAGVAASAAGSVRRSEFWKKGRSAAGGASRVAAAKGLTAATATASASTAALRRGREVYSASVRLPLDGIGRPRRPWEILTAAIVGLVAPLFIVLAVISIAVSGGRTLRSVGWMLRGIGGTTGEESITAAADISAGIANVVVGVGIVVGLVVIAAFAVYSWRVLVGRGRARWVALIALIVSLFVLTPLSPMLVAGFQLCAIASLVFAFLPRSSAWFRHRRGRGRAR